MVAIFFVLLSLGLTIALIVVAVKNRDEPQNKSPNVGQCETSTEKSTNKEKCSTSTASYGKINLDISDNPSVFAHLTESEIRGLRQYLRSVPDLRLVDFLNNLNKSFIFMSEIYLPEKQEVLNYLDKGGSKPPREAHVVLYRGDEQPPYIEELIVGPLPTPTSHRPIPNRPRKIPFEYRPPYLAGEYSSLSKYVKETLEPRFKTMLLELYGGSFLNCDDKCLNFAQLVPINPLFTNNKERKMWCGLTQRVEYDLLHPLDFYILVNIDFTTYSIEKFWFNGTTLSTIDDVLNYYNSNKATIPKVAFPQYSSTLFSVSTQRGTPPMDPPLQNPQQVSPEGKRYNIDGRHIEYMFWTFDVRMDTIQGPYIYDVRFKNERIAYEIGLQEVSVLYSGYSPIDVFAQLLDSMTFIGVNARALYPGIDCPIDATLIPATFDLGDRDPITLFSSFCVFELNTGSPLRRHQSYYFENGRFYSGMENVVLVVRAVHVIVNYDYIVDFIFYPNGALEIKLTATGFVKSVFYTHSDAPPYTARLQKNLGATIHHHLFNIKIDMDIKGASNRFKTLHVETEEISDKFTGGNTKIQQNKFSTSVKKTELEAAYLYSFDAPKYLVMYNENSEDTYGNKRGYRILNRGMTKQLLPEGSESELLVKWARYQMAITKHNDSERTSSSLYASRDLKDPVVNFSSFIENDDSIIDEVSTKNCGKYP